MQTQINIGFEQLVQLVKGLSVKQQQQLKMEIDKEVNTEKASAKNFETLLLNGPVATKKQLKIIANTRKAINQWRTK